MSGRDDTPSRYRRVVLDLPPREVDRLVLQAAAELARFLDAELHAVFVEDPALAALADLPFARELRLPTHEWAPMTGARLADEMRLAVSRARRDLDTLRAVAGVRGTTEIHKGDPASLLATICVATDIVVVPPPRQPVERAMGLHARRSLAVYHCVASVMVLPSTLPARHGPIAVVVRSVDDESLAVAARIAARAGEDLVVLAPPELHMADIQAAVSMRVGARVRTKALAGQTGADVLMALRGLSARLLVLTRGTALPDTDSTLREIVEGGSVPVLALEPTPL